MVAAHIAPDPDARSIRPELVAQDIMDGLAYALNAGEFTSAEIHRETVLQDLLAGNGRVVGHAWSSSLRYYKHSDDPDWAVIFNTDCKGDAERGKALLEPLLGAQAEETEQKE